MGERCFGHPELITDEDYAVSAAEHAWRAGLPWVYSATVGTLRGLMSSYLRRGRASFTAAAAGVQAPTLVIWGQRDGYLGSDLAEPEHDDVPNLEGVERLPDASHWVHHDEAERVNELLIDFFTPSRES